VLIHAICVALGLQLIAVDESGTGSRPAANVLPESWNARSPDFTLKYEHSDGAEVVLLKIVKLANRTLLHGMAEKSEKDVSFEVITSDYVSTSYFPSSSSDSLVHGFISADRLAEFTSKFTNTAIKILIPELEVDVIDTSTGQAAEQRAPPSQQSTAVPRTRQEEPNISPLLEPHQPYAARRRNPLEIGREDLDPFPNPFAPPPLFGDRRGGGMIVGPDHPLFDGRGASQPSGPWGGDGFLPPLGAPPGARFDPVGPFGRGGFPGVGRGGRGRGAFGGDPDNDEFMPPGNFGSNFGGPGNNMYM